MSDFLLSLGTRPASDIITPSLAWGQLLLRKELPYMVSSNVLQRCFVSSLGAGQGGVPRRRPGLQYLTCPTVKPLPPLSTSLVRARVGGADHLPN